MARRKQHESGTASFTGFAKLIGERSPSYITQLKGEGRLVLTDDGKRVRIQESIALIKATADPSKSGVAARHAATRGETSETAGNPTPPATGGAHEPAGAFQPAADKQDRAGSTYQASRAVRERYLAMEAKRAYEVAIGKLMSADAVVAAVASATATLRTRLESLPDVLGPQLAAISDEQQARATLAEAIEHALEETARQFATIAQQEAA